MNWNYGVALMIHFFNKYLKTKVGSDYYKNGIKDYEKANSRDHPGR